jgi:hypothetical protein
MGDPFEPPTVLHKHMCNDGDRHKYATDINYQDDLHGIVSQDRPRTRAGEALVASHRFTQVPNLLLRQAPGIVLEKRGPVLFDRAR